MPIGRDSPALKDLPPGNYARLALDKQRLGQLIHLISNIKVGNESSHAIDVLGRLVDRTHRERTEEGIRKIADTHHAWRNTGRGIPRPCPKIAPGPEVSASRKSRVTR